MPQAAPDQGSNLANGATGIATINLRGLGRRPHAGADRRQARAGGQPDPAYATDINAIPAPLIQRVEVLTGGASSIYGSDAVAGVVNFIMNDHFEGVQLDWNGSGYNHQQNSFVGGLVAGKASDEPGAIPRPGQRQPRRPDAELLDDDGRQLRQRQGQRHRLLRVPAQPTRSCRPPATSARARCAGGNDGLYLRRLQHQLSGTVRRLQQLHTTSRSRMPPVTCGPTSAPTDAFNFAPYNYFQRPDTRYLANFFAHYDALPKVRAYAEFDFMNDQTLAQIAPSGAFLQPFTLHNENPLLSQQFKDAVGLSAANPISNPLHRPPQHRGRRAHRRLHAPAISASSPARRAASATTSGITTPGGNPARTRRTQIYRNDFSVRRLQNAPSTSSPIPRPACRSCRSVLSTAATRIACRTTSSTSAASRRRPSITCRRRDSRTAPRRRASSGITREFRPGLELWLDAAVGQGRHRRRVRHRAPRRKAERHHRRRVRHRRSRRTGRRDARLSTASSPSTEPYAEIRVPIMQRQPWAYDLSVNASLPLLELQHRHARRIPTGSAPNGRRSRKASSAAATSRPCAPRTSSSSSRRSSTTSTTAAIPAPARRPTATLAQCLRTGLTAVSVRRQRSRAARRASTTTSWAAIRRSSPRRRRPTRSAWC